jgi:hypothetical protein
MDALGKGVRAMALLRNVRVLLGVDAAVCAVGAVGLLVAAGMLAPATGLPEGLLRGAGLVLVPWVAFLAWCASQAVPPRRAVLAVVVLNLLWAADSVLLLATGWVSPNGAGVALVLVQAAMGAGIAVLQALALPPAGGLQRA